MGKKMVKSSDELVTSIKDSNEKATFVLVRNCLFTWFLRFLGTLGPFKLSKLFLGNDIIFATKEG